GVSLATLAVLAILAAICLLALAVITRPLLFSSLQPELAEAKGVNPRVVSMLFLGIVALTTAACAQVVGVLLVFALMVGPAAAAQRLTARLAFGVTLAAVIALIEAWGGIALAYQTDWPASFWITALSAAGYFLSLVLGGRIARPRHVHA